MTPLCAAGSRLSGEVPIGGASKKRSPGGERNLPGARHKEEALSKFSVHTDQAKATAKATTRVMRGVALFRERGDEIEYLTGSLWAVPSCSGSALYVVDLKVEECECPDRPPEGEVCKHIYAAQIARAKSGECAGCGSRRRHRELTELHEDNHDNLTYFHGDQLCQECANGAGVLA